MSQEWVQSCCHLRFSPLNKAVPSLWRTIYCYRPPGFSSHSWKPGHVGYCSKRKLKQEHLRLEIYVLNCEDFFFFILLFSSVRCRRIILPISLHCGKSKRCFKERSQQVAHLCKPLLLCLTLTRFTLPRNLRISPFWKPLSRVLSRTDFSVPVCRWMISHCNIPQIFF